MIGVKFGEKHSSYDYGLVLSSKRIGTPDIKKTYIDIPGRNGELDLSTVLTGYPIYNNRTLEFVFTKPYQNKAVWASTLSEIMNDIHGKSMDIILDDDTDFRYVGVVSVKEYALEKDICTITIECNCSPFKYERIPQFVKVDSAKPPGKFIQLIADTFRGYSSVGTTEGQTGFIEVVGERGVVSVYGYIPPGITGRISVSTGNSVGLTSGHKYYIRSGNEEIYMRLQSFAGADIGENENEYIFLSNSTRSDLFATLYINPNEYISTEAKPSIVDLTALYGAGNEPNDMNDSRIDELRNLLNKRSGVASIDAIVLGNGDAPSTITASVEHSDNEPITKIRINGNPVSLTYGRYDISEELEPGSNIITFEDGLPNRTVMLEYTKGWL